MAALHHKWLVRFLPSTVQDISELGYGHLPLHLGIPGANTSPWGWRSTLKGIHSLRHVLVQSFSLVYLDDGKYLGGGCWTMFVLYFAWFEAGIVSSRSRFVFHYKYIYIYVLHSLSLRRLLNDFRYTGTRKNRCTFWFGSSEPDSSSCWSKRGLFVLVNYNLRRWFQRGIIKFITRFFFWDESSFFP